MSKDIFGNIEWSCPDKIISGIAKLTQIFVIQLFSVMGTSIAEPNSGTTLMKDIATSFLDESYIKSKIYNAISEIVAKMKQEQAIIDIENKDEMIESASVTNIDYKDDTLFLGINIITQSDKTISIVLPIKKTIYG